MAGGLKNNKLVAFAVDGNEYICEDGWNYLTRERLIDVAKILCNKAVDEVERGLLLLVYLFDLKPKVMGKPNERLTNFMKINGAGLRDILYGKDGLTWLWGTSTLTEYTITDFWHKGIYYTGAPNGMLNVCTDDITSVERLWAMYHNTKDEGYLNKIIAVLYRPVNPFYWAKSFVHGYSGDRRLPLNNYLFRIRSKRFEMLDAGLRMALIIQFIGNLERFHKRFPNVFPKAKQVRDNDTEVQKPSLKMVDPLHWERIMMRVAEKSPFGSFDNLGKTDKDRVFVYLDMISKEAKETERNNRRSNIKSNRK